MGSNPAFENVRRRRPLHNISSDILSEEDETFIMTDRKKYISTGTKLFIFLVLWQLFNFALISYKSHDFPKPLSASEAGASKYSEERAREFLEGLTSFGVRSVGSDANEKQAFDYIVKEVEKIKLFAKEKVKIDVQIANGSFDLKFFGGFTNVYQNIRNIVVRLSSTSSHDRKALLVNCHYDSAFSSPGASDDAVSCASMMEVLRVLAASNNLINDVIFLFNGAEETILQGSHAFVTQHKWFRDVEVFVNLEAAGSSGKDMLFQATAGAEWMLDLFAREAPDPHVSVLGQEIFQSGAIPSDTDFRIFRDYGGIPGLDFAYIRNGYVYHTRHDNVQQIGTGCLQRSGENLLSLVKTIASKQPLPHPPALNPGRMVFLDLSGLVVLIFPASFLTIINIILITSSFTKILISLRSKDYRRGFTLTLIAIALTWIASTAVSLLLALFIDSINRQMSWYSKPWLLFMLYGLPVIVTNMLSVQLVKYSSSRRNINTPLLAHLFNDCHLFYAIIILSILTYFQIASSFIITVLSFFFFFQSFIYSFFSPSKLSTHFTSPKLIFHFLSSLFPIFLITFLIEGVLVAFVPIMGRSGVTALSDVIMAFLIALSTNLLLSLNLSLIVTMDRVKRLIIIMSSITIIFVVLISFTSFGDPFTNHPLHPTNKRVFFQHLRRRLHSKDGHTFQQDNSLVVLPMDRTALNHLQRPQNKEDEEFFRGFQPRKCLDHPYCGWAFYLPAINKINKVYWREAEELQVEGAKVTFEQPILNSTFIMYSFNITGNQYMNVYVSVQQEAEVLQWNYDVINPTQVPSHLSTRKHYFVSLISASQPPNHHRVSFVYKCASKVECKEGLVQMAVVTNDFENATSQTLRSLLRNLPPTVSPVSSQSTYDSWIL